MVCSARGAADALNAVDWDALFQLSTRHAKRRLLFGTTTRQRRDVFWRSRSRWLEPRQTAKRLRAGHDAAGFRRRTIADTPITRSRGLALTVGPRFLCLCDIVFIGFLSWEEDVSYLLDDGDGLLKPKLYCETGRCRGAATTPGATSLYWPESLPRGLGGVGWTFLEISWWRTENFAKTLLFYLFKAKSSCD